MAPDDDEGVGDPDSGALPAGRAGDPYADLPYPRWMTGLLGPLRSGFRVANTWLTVPLIERGLGPLLVTPATGSILVLRTRGRSTGLIRQAPLGYALVDGRIVVVAGYGRTCHWFRNALAEPRVEVALPGAVLAGYAEEVTDPVELRRAFRAVAGALGAIGVATLGDVARAGDDRVDELARGFPVLAITPTGVLPGPYDPGGSFWRLPFAATVMAGMAAGVAAGAARRRRRGRADRAVVSGGAERGRADRRC